MTEKSVVSSMIERVTILTNLSYVALRQAFEAELGAYDANAGARLVADRSSWDIVEQAVAKMTGPHGLLLMHRVDQGQIASLKGTQRHCTLYLVGNPIIATQIVAVDIRAGMLVPFRVEIYDEGDVASISYDLPSSFIGSLGHMELASIGAELDTKIVSVITAASE